MKITLTKKPDGYEMTAIRRDQTEDTTGFPNKGPFPHDAMHFVVEQELRFETAFWGRVAAGTSIADVGLLAKAGRQASAKRAD